jgi:hypothetical protein
VKWITFLVFIFPFFCWSAPYPATGSSALTEPEYGFYFQHKGFNLKTIGTDWVPMASPNSGLLDTIRLSSKDKQKTGSLSVRTDKVSKSVSLSLYAKKWMRDYPSYGFEVLAAKNFQLNGSPALVVDMLSRTKNKQLRQVIFKNEDRVAILTCMDSKDTFKFSIESCNHIIKTFTWVENQKLQ